MKQLKNHLFICFAFLGLLIAGFAHATTVSYSATQSKPTIFNGFGAMVWDGPGGAAKTTLQQLYQLPGFRMARINHEIRHGTIPSTGTLADYQAVWNGCYQYDTNTPPNCIVYNADGATDLQLPGGTFQPIQFLYYMKVPSNFITTTYDGSGNPINKLNTNADLQSLANYMVAGIQHFNATYGALASCPAGNPACPYMANYMEVSNEPNGTWTVQFTTKQYSDLIEKIGLTMSQQTPPLTTKITGPGVGNIDWSSGTDSYVNALSSTARKYMGAWSVHQYIYSTSGGKPYENIDPYPSSGFFKPASPTGVGYAGAAYFFPRWYATPKSISPNIPVIVGEVGTKGTGYHNINYPAPNYTKLCTNAATTGSDCTIVHTTSFGVRMYTYLISLLSTGVNTALYWEAMDQTWYTSGLGLFSPNHYPTSADGPQPKTNYYAMLPLFQNLVPNSTVLTSSTNQITQGTDDIYSAAFLTPLNANGTANCVVLAHANGTGKTTALSRTVNVNNLPITGYTGYTTTTTLFSQLTGGTVYQSQTTTDPHSTFSLANGTLTHTTSLANDTTVTAKVCFTY